MSLSKGTLAALPLLALPFTLASELDHYEEPGEYDVTSEWIKSPKKWCHTFVC